MMQRRTAFMYVCLTALFMALTVGRAASEEASPAESQAIRLVVQSQLDALARDDAEKAFKLATSSMQLIMGSPDDLLSLVKREFTPIYRPRHTVFKETEIIDRDALQVVELTDQDGRIWIAFYQVELQTNGEWKIDGCQLFETGDKFI